MKGRMGSHVVKVLAENTDLLVDCKYQEGRKSPMSTLTEPRVETVADLLLQLAVPPERIRLNPAPGTATEEDAIRTRACELIDGVLVEKAMGYYESRLATTLIFFLELFLEKNELAFVLDGTALIRVERDQLRLPDVSVFLWKRFPGGLLPQGQILDYVPDLAVEVLSPGNTSEEMARKRRESFTGGAQMVWEVYPEEKSVKVYTSPDEATIVDENGVLDGGTVLPGFSLAVKDWFAKAGRREQ